MSVAEQPKYMWIPPPPLPEFYLPKEQLDKKKQARSSSPSSGTDAEDDAVLDQQKKSVEVVFEKKQSHDTKEKHRQPAITGDGAYDGLPPPPSFYAGAPPPAQAPTGINVPPLAVYHICRICLRPRSARYHREHPIPVDGVPPPPGICHRCRVTSVKEASEIDISEVDEVVRKGQSNDMKIGFITPFVPEEAILSNEEAKKMRAQRELRGRSRERHITIFREASSESQQRYRRNNSRRRDLAYRHVRVVEEPVPTRRTVVACRTEDNTRGLSGRRPGDERYGRRKGETSKVDCVQKDPPSLKGANLARMDSTKASLSSRATSLSSSSATRIAKQTGATVMLKRPERTDSEIRKMVGEEAQRYASDFQRNERSESEIRRIAHEEVARYREAERKLDARPGAFTHGMMASMPRRIEQPQGEPAPIPWKEASGAASPEAVEQHATPRASEPAKSVRAESYHSSDSRARSVREYWGPQWRRELSLERRKSYVMKESCNVEVAEGRKSKASAPPPDLPRDDKPSSPCDVGPGSYVSTRTLKTQPPAASDSSKRLDDRTSPGKPVQDSDMGPLFPMSRQYVQRNGFDQERETVERLSVTRSAVQHDESNPAASNVSKSRKDKHRAEMTRSTCGRSYARWGTSGSGSMARDSAISGGKARERGSVEGKADLIAKEKSRAVGGPPPDLAKKPDQATTGPNVQYEYKLHTIRPADPRKDPRPREGASAQRSGSPGYVTLEIWQQVPRDPGQRAREAPMQERERKEAVEWLKTRIDDPTAQVGVDPDGSRRLACSIPHRKSDRQQRALSPPARRPSPRQSAPPRDRSPRRQQITGPDRTSGNRGGGVRADRLDKEMVVEVWEQVPADEAARYRRQNSLSRRSGGADTEPKEFAIEAWKQVPSDRTGASNVRRDSAMEMPPARRRRERREHPNRASEDSAHVKFASKVEISPTPPGTDESSNAFRRFHDFVGRKASRQQIDGHDSEERGEDLIAEYERRGRLRSRHSPRQESEYGYDSSRVARNRDETVKPGNGQRRYDGRRDEGWRPLDRA